MCSRYSMRRQFELPGPTVGKLQSQSGRFAIYGHGKGPIVGRKEKLRAQSAHIMMDNRGDDEVAGKLQVCTRHRLSRFHQAGNRSFHVRETKTKEIAVFHVDVVGVPRPFTGRRSGVEVAVE